MNRSPESWSTPELASLEETAYLSTEVTCCPLAQEHPALFASLTTEYRLILQQAAAKTSSWADGETLSAVSGLARRAGAHGAVPLDLIAVHLTALATVASSNERLAARTSLGQARLLLLKMVGELALYYRSKVSLAKAAAQ